MNYWFTSDTHFGHVSIIKHCNRPFASVEEMDEEMVKRWNSVVGNGDIVYHLGDFSLIRDAHKIQDYVKRLKGQIHLIYGNHDAKRMQFLKGFADVKPYKEVKVNNQKVVLFHYPILSWNGMHRGTWHLHGHSHGSGKRDLSVRRFDVGTDVWNFTPLSFDQVADEMKKHSFVAVDHHKEKTEDM